MKIEEKHRLIDNIIWAINEVVGFKKGYLLVLVSNAVIRGVSPIVSLLLTQRLIDMIQFRTSSLKDVVVFFSLLTVIQIFFETIIIIINTKLNNYELEFDLFFQKKILSKVSSLGCKDFENSHTYDLINRAQYDVNSGVLGTIKLLFSLTAFLISSISYSIIMLRFNMLVFLIIVIAPIVRYFVGKKYNLKEYALEKENTEPNRKIGYISYLLTNAEYFKEIKTFGLFVFLLNRFQAIKAFCNNRLISLNNEKMRSFTFLTIIEKIIDWSVSIYILMQALLGTVSIGGFVLYNNTINSLQANIISMFSQLSGLYKNSAMIDQLRYFFYLQPEEINEAGINIDRIHSVVLKNVSYKYQGKSEYALKDINLELKPKELTVIMGNNGSGKTTLVRIIMGIYSDYTGTILINGQDFRKINMVVYRQKISALFQNYTKYESSISDNIRYGNVREDVDDRRIKEILNRVHLEEWVDKTEQVLGYQFRDGTQMSVGQWQKLALGRSLYRDADVYIFDEPNASLDLLTESSVLRSIQDETIGKITIIIMHRFNYMVRNANRIIVMNNGMIEEIGTHDVLIGQRGLYYNLYSIHKKIHETDQ